MSALISRACKPPENSSNVCNLQMETKHSYEPTESELYDVRTKRANLQQKRRVHIPHGLQTPMAVVRRNTRERIRVKTMNSEFSRLRRLLPHKTQNNVRLSKENTLVLATQYIHQLRRMVAEHDNWWQTQTASCSIGVGQQVAAHVWEDTPTCGNGSSDETHGHCVNGACQVYAHI